MIIKNLDYLFQNVFTDNKAQKKNKKTQIFQIEQNNTRCNKINQMAALRMDLVFIDIHT